MSELIERLEKLEGPVRAIDGEIDCLAMWGPHSEWENAGGGYERHKATGEQRSFGLWSRGTPAYTASLDAAVALVERLGLQWLRKSLNTMTVFRMPSDDKTWATHFEETGATPAIALLIATLKALEQQND